MAVWVESFHFDKLSDIFFFLEFHESNLAKGSFGKGFSYSTEIVGHVDKENWDVRLEASQCNLEIQALQSCLLISEF